MDTVSCEKVKNERDIRIEITILIYVHQIPCNQRCIEVIASVAPNSQSGNLWGIGGSRVVDNILLISKISKSTPISSRIKSEAVGIHDGIFLYNDIS